MGPRDRADVLRTIERRIVENRDSLDGARERGETLNVEFLRGCISELEIVQRVVEALPIVTATWVTDMSLAPRGEDVLVAMSSAAEDGTCATMIGMLIFEPMVREVDDTDEDDEGYWGEHNGQTGIYYWHASDADGHVPKKWLKAWRPLPEPFKQPK